MESDKQNFEMAHADDLEAIIAATQRSVIFAIKGVIADTRAEMKEPGLTWQQIDFILDHFEKKQPTIVFQKEEM